MKKLMLLLVVLFTFSVQAQRGMDRHEREGGKRLENVSPEQMATLKSKQMMLHLDLSDSQYNKVYALELANVKEMKSKKEKSKKLLEMSKDEKFAAKEARLDAMIAYKKQMKSILDEKQYVKWQKIAAKKSSKRLEKMRDRR